jgi:hypothetical protein
MTDAELLWNHRPAFCFDAQEPYRPLTAESITDNVGNRLLRADGTAVAEPLTLDLLATYDAPDAGDRIDQAGDLLEVNARLGADPAYANRVYGRVVRNGELTWLQYWCWYLDNPKHLLGFGRHQGDWEFVQIGLHPDGETAVVTCSQHEAGEARDFAKVEVAHAGGGTHPVIYVAPFSHANYFEPGAHPYFPGNDEPDGSLAPVLPAHLEEFGEWADWPGRWGGSRGKKVVFARLGRSPDSPGCQGDRWSDPAAYHRKARRKTVWRRIGRLLRRLGARTYPKLSAVTALVDGRKLTVDYVVAPGLLRPATQLYVTVHDAVDPERIVLTHVEEISDRAGTVELELPDDLERCLVRASAYNALRQRSDPVEAEAQRR